MTSFIILGIVTTTFWLALGLYAGLLSWEAFKEVCVFRRSMWFRGFWGKWAGVIYGLVSLYFLNRGLGWLFVGVYLWLKS